MGALENCEVRHIGGELRFFSTGEQAEKFAEKFGSGVPTKFNSQELASLYFKYIPESKRTANSAAEMLRHLQEAAKSNPDLAKMLKQL